MSTSQTRVEDGQDNKEQRVRRGEPDHASQRQMAASSEALARRRQAPTATA